jgi:hypothetical protein
VDQRDVARAKRRVHRRALLCVECDVERFPAGRGERAGRLDHRRYIAEAREVARREGALRALEGAITAVERDLRDLGIERVVAIDLVDGAIEHQPQRLLLPPFEDAADRSRLLGVLAPQPDRIAGREAQVVEIDRIGHRHAHAHAITRRRLFVDDSQICERDAERDALREHATRTLHRDLRARSQPLGPPGGSNGIQPVARILRHAIEATPTFRCGGRGRAAPRGIVSRPCPSRPLPSASPARRRRSHSCSHIACRRHPIARPIATPSGKSGAR